jgi:Zn-dependent M28 family amino/carboxypeptidase
VTGTATTATQAEKAPAAGILGSGRTVTVKKTVEFLASDERGGRDVGSPGIERAAVYIEGRFKRSKLKPYFGSSFRSGFEVKGVETSNVVAMIEGTDPKLKNEIIVIGAHYDHIGNGKAVNGDRIANGANDNAAGTATVLAIADHFAKANNNKRTLVFALFSAEEKGLLGSSDMAQKMKRQGANVYAMFNVEMVGVPMNGKDHIVYCSGYDLSNIAAKFNGYAGRKVIGFLPKAKEFNLFQRSDNYPFYKVFKVPAHTVSSFDFTNYDYYHKVDDEASEMDYVHMQKVIDQLVPGIAGMANSATKEIKMK